MIRTGEQYRNGLRDGREIWIDGERVKDVTRHPAIKPIVDIRARMYDMQHEDAYALDADLCRRQQAAFDLQPPAARAEGLARQVDAPSTP